jgi:hypothetical protein
MRNIMTQYIHGVFGGALVICLLMLNFSEPKTCAVTMKHGNGNNMVSYVTVGAYDDAR